VHELAETLGIDHRSEGIEGVDRRIILSIPKSTSTLETKEGVKVANVQKDQVNVETFSIEDEKEGGSVDGSKPSKFDLLAGSDDDEDEEESERESECLSNDDVKTRNNLEITVSNSLLGNLAQERARRERDKQNGAATAMDSKSNPTKSLPKQPTPKKKGKKLGGAKKVRPAEVGEEMDDVDDMAFLDAVSFVHSHRQSLQRSR